MGTYTPQSLLLPNGLDEIGLDYSLKRFEGESLSHYRKRLLQEARSPAGSTQEQFIASLNRQIGFLDDKIFEVDLIRDANDDPLAPDPFIEITSSWLRAYYDYENDGLDFDLSLVDRSEAYFLRDIETAFTASAYFNITVLVSGTDYEFYRSDHLRYGNSDRFMGAERLSASRSHKLAKPLIKQISAQASNLFQNEVADVSLIVDPGDYFVDYVNGVIFLEDVGAGLVSYSYREFPYPLFYQPVRAYPLSDKDIKYRNKDTQISDDTGLIDYTLLNEEGARIANELYQIHPLGWGN